MDSDVEVARARLGRTVGDHWLLERVLGTGGMGAVYAARSADGSIAAIKILHPEMGARREVRERFLREGSAANKIGHPGVVRMLGQGDGEEAFLAMELLEGETLRDRVRRHGRLPVDEVLDVASQVLDVLVAAHARGVIHRDLKPDNLFVTLDGRVKVLDFGLARLLDGIGGQHQTRTGVALGTLAYMAPEQALGRRAEIDGRVDLFALGATLFRVLSGRRVHEAESEAELLMAMASRPAPPLKAVAPDVPDTVAAVIDLALAFARDARYPDASTMLADVTALRRGGPPPFATSRLASRDEPTRPDGLALGAPADAAPVPGSQRTQPMPMSQRTVPLVQFTAPVNPYGATAPAAARVAAAPAFPSGAPPASTRTEPLAQVPLPPAPPANPTPAPAVNPPAQGRRGLVALAVVLGTLVVAGVGGAVAYFMLGSSSATVAGATSSALPAPLPSPTPPAASATTAGEPHEGARAKSSAPHARATAVVHAKLAPEPPPAPSAGPASTGSAALAPTANPSALAPPPPAPSAAGPLPPDAGAHGHAPRGHARKPHG